MDRKRQWREKGTNKVSHSQTYYISSYAPDADALLKIVHGRWGIENRGHYVLDVIFGEDRNRSVRDYGLANLALLRRVCMNLVRVAPGAKGSWKGRIKQASWDYDSLKQLLSTPVPDRPLVSAKIENSEAAAPGQTSRTLAGKAEGIAGLQVHLAAPVRPSARLPEEAHS